MNAKGNNTKSRFFWFSSSVLILVFGVLQTQDIFAQCELYKIDFIAQQDSTNEYQVSCGDVSGSVSSAQWTVTNNLTCTLTTAGVTLGGTTGNLVSTPIAVEILNEASTTSCDDYVIIQYQIDNGSWITQDSINACDMPPNIFTYNFNVVCGDTSAIKTRVIMSVSDNNGSSASEKLRIRDGGICISTPTPISMPVQLTNFTLHELEKGIQLKWSVASENNNSGYEIQRSQDGHNFSKIGFVEGQGASQTSREYVFMDINNNMSGTYYYRLKQIDNNGTSYAYSFIMEISLTVDERDKFSVSQHYPNPTRGKTKVDVYLPEDGTVSVMIHDVVGQSVKGFGIYLKEGSHTVDINVSDLTSGTYFYTVSFSGSSESVTSKMLVMK